MEFSDLTDAVIEAPESASGAATEYTTDPQEVAAEMPQATASWVVSLCFWMTLVLASVMYAGVALSPKLAEWISAREQFAGNAAQLVRLEDDIEYLERVKNALESDPQFARRLAQASMPDQFSQGEILPVATELLFGGQVAAVPISDSQIDSRRSGPATVVFHLASHQEHRRMLLAASVLLTIMGFTFLNDSESGSLRAIGRAILWVARIPLRRYSKTVPGPAIVSENTNSEA